MQETICNRLSGTKGTLVAKANANAVAGDDSDAQLLKELRQAHSTLAQLNRVYAALLKRASRSVELMAAFYRSYGQSYNCGPSRLPQRHSWSCEV